MLKTLLLLISTFSNVEVNFINVVLQSLENIIKTCLNLFIYTRSLIKRLLEFKFYKYYFELVFFNCSFCHNLYLKILMKTRLVYRFFHNCFCKLAAFQSNVKYFILNMMI